MAIKDQCLRCKLFTQFSENGRQAENCVHYHQAPIYNSTSCEYWQSRGIDLSKNDNQPLPPSSPQPTNTPYNPVVNPAPNGQGQRKMFSKLFSSKGRIRRLEYCLTYLAVYLFALPMNIIPEDDLDPIFCVIWLLLLIPALWIFYAQGAKRCHDRDNSGWYQLIPFYFLVMMFGDGDKGDNTYGPSPKY